MSITATLTRRPAAAERAAQAAAASVAAEVRFERVNRIFPAAGRRSGAGGAAARGPLQVLRDINLTVEPGEVLAILGASGCGKSTLLRITGGLDRASSGSVLIDGVPVSGIDSRSAVAFQEPRLLPWRTVSENVSLGLPRGGDRKDGRERVARLLELVGLADFAGHRPREISGGMAQRASLARALARNPGVLLLDEPFGALDALTRINMQDLLLEVHAAEPTTVLLVTHDVDEALQLADRIILLGKDDAMPGADIRQVITIPGARPRDRSSAELAALRGELLAGLGIERH